MTTAGNPSTSVATSSSGRGFTAVVLAGGLGTRLASVVADRPKPLALVDGEPFLLRLLGGRRRRRFTITAWRGRFRRRLGRRRCRGAPEERIAQARERTAFFLIAQNIAQLVLHDLFDRRSEAHARPGAGDAEGNAQARNACIAALALA